jgi:hypothetical protein
MRSFSAFGRSEIGEFGPKFAIYGRKTGPENRPIRRGLGQIVEFSPEANLGVRFSCLSDPDQGRTRATAHLALLRPNRRVFPEGSQLVEILFSWA